MHRTRLALSVATGLLLLHGSARAGEPAWLRASTTNLELLTTGEARMASAALAELESLRTYFRESATMAQPAGTHVRIVAFSSEWEYQPYRLNSYSPAYFVGGPGQLTIVLGRLAKETLPALRHEYVHSLLRMQGWDLPLWLEEGLAEHFAGISAGTARARITRLERDGPLGLARLDAVTRESASYTQRDAALRFYGESWALVNLLMTHPAYRDAAWQFFAECGAGMDPAAAVTAVFGRVPSQVEEDLRAHIRRLKPAQPAPSRQAGPMETSAAGELEVADALGRLRLMLNGGAVTAAPPAPAPQGQLLQILAALPTR
jgi:hypothetical protein